MTSISVSNNGAGSYNIDGSSNPSVAMIRGTTYVLSINAPGHPFWIQTVSGGYSSNNIYNSGVTNNGTDDGDITFIVPSDAPNTLYYACQFHSSMQGTILITDPVLPSPSLTNFSIPARTYLLGDTFTLTDPSSNSSEGAFSYSSSNNTIASISGSNVNILKAGTVTITATQAASTNYESGSITATLLINPPKPYYYMLSLFGNNSQVYYKPHSLSTGSGGSGVGNHRVKQRRT